MYGVGLGINSNLEPILGFKMSWKIKNVKKPAISIPIDITPTIE